MAVALTTSSGSVMEDGLAVAVVMEVDSKSANENHTSDLDVPKSNPRGEDE